MSIGKKIAMKFEIQWPANGQHASFFDPSIEKSSDFSLETLKHLRN